MPSRTVLILLFIGVCFSAGGCFHALFPAQAIEMNRRFVPRKAFELLGLTPTIIRALGYIEIIVGIILLGLALLGYIRSWFPDT